MPTSQIASSHPNSIQQLKDEGSCKCEFGISYLDNYLVPGTVASTLHELSHLIYYSYKIDIFITLTLQSWKPRVTEFKKIEFSHRIRIGS